MRALVLRFTAPLMSFGTVAVDAWRPSGSFPALSAVTGLLGAALGYKRHETDKLQRLQDRLRIGARIDRRGELLTDYQTVDLGQPRMDGAPNGVGWTTRGHVETRGGGAKRQGTHVRQRAYWADAVATLAVTLVPEQEEPSLEELGRALRRPRHPLYLGRKSCPPAEPILLDESEAPSLHSLLQDYPAHPRADQAALPAQWPVGGQSGLERSVLWDGRDWPNQVHAGSRQAWLGRVHPAAEEGHHDD